MAEAVLFSLATDILKSLATEMVKPGGSFASQKIMLLCCAKDELQSLKGTVQTIQALLLDAEKKQWHNNQVKLWLTRLKDVLYDIQDLLDDVATEDLRQKVTLGNKMLKAVCIFFSKSNQLAHRLKVANEIQELRKRLDLIKNDRQFHFDEHREESMAIVRGRKPENLSPDREIIGREEDKENIKRLLFDSSSSQSVSFVAIVGKGGIGKTALARLVYNDGEVKEHFGPHKMWWVCVSDVFDVNLIIKQILKSAKCQDLDNKPEDQLESLLSTNKYLLVLDDLWNENRLEWLKLGEWLKAGLQGSKILVTTRSHKVATVTDAKSDIHVLGDLSEGKSWDLFRKMAFGDGVELLDPELEKMGRDIVKKCTGVPLAIRTIGGLLYDKNKDEWVRYKVHELPEIPEIYVDGGIMQVLKFSYDHLPSCLKNCFAYCSLFPKDYVYDKDMMIHLWMAQGFIESHNREDNLEEVADNYLSELLCRSFLDAESTTKNGDVVLQFKMHDLMHDLALAQKVAEGECKIVHFKESDNDQGIRHASFISEILSKEKLVHKVFSRCGHCRALCLHHANISLPPSSLGKLKHLRLLHILMNESIQNLPDSITDLVNLQTLKLSDCMWLQTFPRDLRKLFVSINDCPHLNSIPSFPQVEHLWIDGTKMLEQQLLANPNCPSEGTVEATFIPFPKLKHLTVSKRYMSEEPLMLKTLLRSASNLEYMTIIDFNLRSPSCEMQHLSLLKGLNIQRCQGLDFFFQEGEHGTQWQCLTNLRVLTIKGSNLVALPKGIQHVTTLRSLKISEWMKLRGLPEWIGNFSLLEELKLIGCYRLKYIPFEIRNLTRLKKLVIHGSPLLDEGCLADVHMPIIDWKDSYYDSD
ncbi:hypothetical protein EUGRSUZ_H03114 [Eucalyptus grandis]|uniref:NB-ARC domain-containing protein n=2 Tax=Eucalyptus grandis TaxID=71139 RepID=A0A059B2E8_EUCGR|nr:hypothetical protein EUGRSUZ_H03114 [Eucalyptus grandis]